MVKTNLIIANMWMVGAGIAENYWMTIFGFIFLMLGAIELILELRKK